MRAVTEAAAGALLAWEARCKAQGLVVTAPRRAILAALLAQAGGEDAVALLQAARAHHADTSMGTVYRFLRELEQRGLVHAQSRPHGRIRWSLAAAASGAPKTDDHALRIMLDQLRDFLHGLEAWGFADAVRHAPEAAASPSAPRDAVDPTLHLLQQIAARLGYRLQQRANLPY